MITVIANTKPQEGYVVEDANYSQVDLIYYKKNGKSFVPDHLETFDKEDFIDLRNEEDLRQLFKNCLNLENKIIYFREEVDYLVPKN